MAKLSTMAATSVSTLERALTARRPRVLRAQDRARRRAGPPASPARSGAARFGGPRPRRRSRRRSVHGHDPRDNVADDRPLPAVEAANQAVGWPTSPPARRGDGADGERAGRRRRGARGPTRKGAFSHESRNTAAHDDRAGPREDTLAGLPLLATSAMRDDARTLRGPAHARGVHGRAGDVRRTAGSTFEGGRGEAWRHASRVAAARGGRPRTGGGVSYLLPLIVLMALALPAALRRGSSLGLAVTAARQLLRVLDRTQPACEVRADDATRARRSLDEAGANVADGRRGGRGSLPSCPRGRRSAGRHAGGGMMVRTSGGLRRLDPDHAACATPAAAPPQPGWKIGDGVGVADRGRPSTSAVPRYSTSTAPLALGATSAPRATRTSTSRPASSPWPRPRRLASRIPRGARPVRPGLSSRVGPAAATPCRAMLDVGRSTCASAFAPSPRRVRVRQVSQPTDRRSRPGTAPADMRQPAQVTTDPPRFRGRGDVRRRFAR